MLTALPSITELQGGCKALLSGPGILMADDVQTTQRHLARMTEGRARLHTPASRGGVINYSALEVSLGAIQFQAQTAYCQGQYEQSTVRSPENRILLQIPLEGAIEYSQGARSVTVEPGSMLIVSAPGKMWKAWSGRRTWLAVAVQRSAVKRAMATALNFDSDEDAEFSNLTALPVESVPGLFSLIRTIVLDLAAPESIFRQPMLAKSIENTFVLAMLQSLPGRHAEALRQNSTTCMPYYVRRAEKYMRENIHEDITIGDLARVSGVSERTIYYGFRNFLGKSPMRYCALLRLNLAREALIRGRSEGCNITELAISMGYATSSHFSRDYRKRFGESPSDTLRR